MDDEYTLQTSNESHMIIRESIKDSIPIKLV